MQMHVRHAGSNDKSTQNELVLPAKVCVCVLIPENQWKRWFDVSSIELQFFFLCFIELNISNANAICSCVERVLVVLRYFSLLIRLVTASWNAIVLQCTFQLQRAEQKWERQRDTETGKRLVRSLWCASHVLLPRHLLWYALFFVQQGQNKRETKRFCQRTAAGAKRWLLTI